MRTTTVDAVEEYLTGLNEEWAVIARGYYNHARRRIVGLEPGMYDGMPTMHYRGKALFSLIATARGFSMFPHSFTVAADVGSDLAGSPGIAAAKGGVRFTLNHPLPYAAFNRLLDERIREIDRA